MGRLDLIMPLTQHSVVIKAQDINRLHQVFQVRKAFGLSLSVRISLLSGHWPASASRQCLSGSPYHAEKSGQFINLTSIPGKNTFRQF